MANVMVVDDSPLVTRMVTVFLAQFGHDVETVNAPHNVSNLIREAAPDLLVVNPGLSGIGGQGLIYAIRGDDGLADLPIVLISADEAKMKDVVAAGDADDYFVKGHPLAVLEAKIRKLLLTEPVAEVGHKV